jgi:hypothetical protein
MILDNHYRGSDPTYRTPSGVIGDQLSRDLLCSLPAKAAALRVALDSIVAAEIRSQCSTARNAPAAR